VIEKTKNVKTMESKNKILKKLKNEGIAVVENYFDENFCSTVIKEIETIIIEKPEKIFSEGNEDTGNDYRIWGINKYSKICNSFCKDKFLKSIADNYLKTQTKSFFTLAGKVMTISGKKSNSGGGWHRDSDVKQFKSMVYLNDVNKNNGPFLFLKKTDKVDAKRKKSSNSKSLILSLKTILRGLPLKDPRYLDKDIDSFLKTNELELIEVTGSKGTLVLFDSSFIHRGKNIKSGNRYTLTNYYFPKSEKNEKMVIGNFGDYLK
jgi:ectoine hydroxylase-related dioxygenase (phytanoyl-CoA dioxygenase family)